uniref:Uncharacterized protein n=1 Tax=Triticum urartu TaxID=4572 RepID=A0A8R7U556_TRIUA
MRAAERETSSMSLPSRTISSLTFADYSFARCSSNTSDNHSNSTNNDLRDISYHHYRIKKL